VTQSDRPAAGLSAVLTDLRVVPHVSASGAELTSGFFCHQVTATIGVDGIPDSGEQFDLDVCSPSWFAAEWGSLRGDANVFLIWDEHPNIVPGGTFWFMDEWSLADLEGAIRLICARSSPAPDWRTLANLGEQDRKTDSLGIRRDRRPAVERLRRP
jgi:hypothetical protein